MAIAARVGGVQDRWKVADFASGAAAGLKFGLCEVVWEWARGTSFEEITKLTDVAEGTIVRVITRLDETCREVRDAARVIGDAELFKKMEDAQARIKRDSTCYFFFFSSLFLFLILTGFMQSCLLRVCISRSRLGTPNINNINCQLFSIDFPDQRIMILQNRHYKRLQTCQSVYRTKYGRNERILVKHLYYIIGYKQIF